MNMYKPQDIFAEARNEAEVTNFLNNDIYKFLMLDFILTNEEYANTVVERKMTIRSKGIQTAKVIPREALRDQLEATKSIKGVNEADLSFLRGMITNEKTRLFREETLDFLRDFRLPDYEIGVDETNNYTLTFRGAWKTSIFWEIFGLKIINSLYNYYYVKNQKLLNSEFNEIINETLHRLYNDIKIFKQAPGATFSEFGTRRSLSTDYQRIVFDIITQKIPNQCLGTSNVMLSREFGINNPKGTNAHELRMIPTALYDNKKQIIDTMYGIDRQWQKHFPELGILLPDTYGTSYYFENCPDDIFQNHIGCRFDSKDPMVGIPEYVNWLKSRGGNPLEKLGIPSDGLDAESWVNIYKNFNDQLKILTAGIGTNLSNNTKGTWPRETEPYGPFGAMSVVVKPARVQRSNGEWVSCVKLSDNPEKATGDKERVELFKSIFGAAGMQKQKVEV